MPSHETAAAHMATDVPFASEDATVDSVIELIRARSFACADAVFAIDPHEQLIGGLTVGALLSAPGTQLLGELVDRNFPRVREHEDQEHVASAALKRRTPSVAVVDQDGRLLGAVPARSLLAILREEHVEDLHRLAGIQREARSPRKRGAPRDAGAPQAPEAPRDPGAPDLSAAEREALEGPPTRRARHRLPWLLLGLAGSLGSAVLMSRFEHVLARDLAIAFFIPAIVYLADAVGTQTEAITVRGLSLSRLSLRQLLADELRTGLLIGATLAALSFPVVLLTFGNPRLAISVSAAILAAGSFATTIGLLLPWLLKRLGRDPAFGSGPVATIIQDVVSLLIYFALTTLIVD